MTTCKHAQRLHSIRGKSGAGKPSTESRSRGTHHRTRDALAHFWDSDLPRVLAAPETTNHMLRFDIGGFLDVVCSDLVRLYPNAAADPEHVAGEFRAALERASSGERQPQTRRREATVVVQYPQSACFCIVLD